jgi:gamma-glutamyltranspeptidase
MLESQSDKDGLEAAVAAPRVVNVGMPDVTYYEPSLDPAALAALRQRGHSLVAEPGVGRANALSCPDGLRVDPDSCQVASDRRGFGLAVRVQ